MTAGGEGFVSRFEHAVRDALGFVLVIEIIVYEDRVKPHPKYRMFSSQHASRSIPTWCLPHRAELRGRQGLRTGSANDAKG
jgi:hypothetical protein